MRRRQTSASWFVSSDLTPHTPSGSVTASRAQRVPGARGATPAREGQQRAVREKEMTNLSCFVLKVLVSVALLNSETSAGS